MFPSQQSNLWQNLFGNQNIGGTTLQSTIPNYPYAPHQVATGDTFDSIAQTNGLTTQQIQQANGGMLVPPPAGRFVNIPVRGGKPPRLAGNAPFTTYQQAQQSGRVPQQANTPYYQLAMQQANNPPNLGTGVTPGGYGLSSAPPEYVAQVQANINQQVASGSMPDVVPLNTPILNPQTGHPVTPAQMTANGYTLNQQTGQWVLSGANTTGAATLPGGQGGAGTAGNTDFTNTGFMQRYIQQGTAFTEQKRWDPVRKKFIKIGRLINEGKLNVKTGRFNPRGHNRGSGGGQPQQPVYVAPTEATNAGGTPTQQLGQNRGGG